MDNKQTAEQLRCTLSNEHLIEKCRQWVSRLCEKGGNAWRLQVPVNFNEDPDILFNELGNRLAALLSKEAPQAPQPSRVEQMEAMLSKVVKAWDTIPDGKHTINAVEHWLSAHMKPAVKEARALLSEGSDTPAPFSPWVSVEDGNAIQLIAKERERQKNVEGWSEAHDDEHKSGEIARAAAAYCLPARFTLPGFSGRDAIWPWDSYWLKPTPNDRIRELTKAGALIVAEIERLQRAAPPSR